LKDVSFDVNQGEVVGIIGRNGAGKSTLLKILSRIVRPTSGEVIIRGRVGSLLEVGTGFHPELTGRENIFMNGAVLGMKRAEIVRKFDEIVAFAEVEKFLDTPVKFYSSGMYVRLAFAVAAHLEPEILIVDEVLAVGDAQFQKKCLGKMNEVSQKEGKTVLFVSHQMSMISSLCQKAILLEQGKITKLGSSSDVILSYYYSDNSSPAYINFTKAKQRIGDEYAELLECYVKNRQGEIITEGSFDDEIIIGMRYKILLDREFDRVYPYPNCNVFSGDGTHVFYTTMPNSQIPYPKIGEYIAEFAIPRNFLNSGTYFVGLALSTCDNGVQVHFYEQNALCFQIKENLDNTLYDTRNGWSGVLPGVVHPQLSWKLQPVIPNSFGLEYRNINTSLQMEGI
jgi:lipopolysaccharide transport system ATP-binding protein